MDRILLDQQIVLGRKLYGLANKTYRDEFLKIGSYGAAETFTVSL